MANPQLEDGRTEVANEIMDALMRVNFSPYERRVLDCILRKTYGWHKKMDRISYTQFEEATELDRRHIARSLGRLITRNIITVSGNGRNLEYGLQKDYESWQSLPKQATQIITSAGNNALPKQATIHEKESLPPGAESLPKQATQSLPKQANTKAIKHNKSITKANKGFQVEVPKWVDRDTWDAYLEMRRAKRASPTQKAVELIIKKLDTLRESGQDVTEILNQSIINNWTGVFPLKREVKDERKGQQRRDDAAAGDTGEILRKKGWTVHESGPEPAADQG